MDRTKLRADLARDEGKKLLAYRDSLGYWTIGVGHLLGSSPRMSTITEAECQALLDYDVAQAESLARECVPLYDTLDEARQRALVNMAFNRGGHMRDSATITPAINAAAINGVWGPVGDAILGSPWAKQVGPRAGRLAHMLVTGTDPT